jgi:cytochrome P450
VLSRYEDVVAAAKDHERFSNNPRWREATTSVLPPAPDDYSILLMDPPDHSRLRRVAGKAFTRARLDALSETISRAAAELMEEAARRRVIDWIADVAAPLSMHVMLTMMGLSERDSSRWETWVRSRARLLEMIATRPERRTAHRAGAEIQRYFSALLRRRRDSDDDDAVSTFAREIESGDGISMPEASDMLSVLMIAGNETTTNLVGNGMLALLRHPGQMQALREEPERMHDAIDEMLRFDSPVQTDFRIARAEAAVGERTIRPGDGVILLTGSANRDEAAFEHSDTFDITRKGPRHTSFGHGVHYCIGAELARMEASAIFTEALRSTDRIELCGEPYYRPSTVIRGLTALPLRIDGR